MALRVFQTAVGVTSLWAGVGCVGPDTTSRPTPDERTGRPEADTDTDTDTDTFPASRDAWQWPFTSGSAWNMPVGAELATDGGFGACARDLRDGSTDAWVNAEEWSHPVYQTNEGDPLVAITEDGVRMGEVRSPSYAIPADPQYPDGDAHLYLIDPDGRVVTEMWEARLQEGGWEVSSVATVDLYGSGIGTDGVRIYGGSAIGGLIRTGEIETEIRHALALSLPLAALEPRAVWPATVLDTSREDEMLGAVPVGQLVVLPADTDVSIARTAGGRALIRALRDYGAYVVDHASNFALYAEPGAESEIDAARGDLDAIRGRLECATNTSEEAPGGPGARVQPLAPELE